MPEDKENLNAPAATDVEARNAYARAFDQELAAKEASKKAAQGEKDQRDRLWSIKNGVEVTDKHSGLTLRFGAHQDDSNTVFLTISYKDVGTNLVFKREGEILQMQPIRALTDEQRQAMADADLRAKGAKLLDEQDKADAAQTLKFDDPPPMENREPEPYRENTYAPKVPDPAIDTRPRPADGPAPAGEFPRNP